MKQILLESISKHKEDREVIRDSHYGFTRGKPCMTDMMAFYSWETVLVDKGKATNTICLDFWEAFGRVPHNILVSKLER